MKLYEIAEAYQSLANAEDVDELEIYLENIQDEFDIKAVNLVYIIKDYESDMETLRTEEKRLATKRKSLEGKRDWLKDYLYHNMKLVGREKVKAGTYDLRIQKNPKSVRILDASKIEGDYLKIKTEIDKQKIKQDIESGIEVPGADLVQGEGLRIK